MKQVTWKLDGSRLDIHGERIYYMPEGLPDVRGIRFLRTGLLLGELKKNRFEPSQAFAMCLKKDEYAQIIDLPCEDERVRRYLKGEDTGCGRSDGEKSKRLVSGMCGWVPAWMGEGIQWYIEEQISTGMEAVLR